MSDSATPWISRPEYWSGEPIPSPVDLPNLGIKPRSPALQVDSLPGDLPGATKTGFKSLQRTSKNNHYICSLFCQYQSYLKGNVLHIIKSKMDKRKKVQLSPITEQINITSTQDGRSQRKIRSKKKEIPTVVQKSGCKQT